jgi:hypothetical protein
VFAAHGCVMWLRSTAHALCLLPVQDLLQQVATGSDLAAAAGIADDNHQQQQQQEPPQQGRAAAGSSEQQAPADAAAVKDEEGAAASAVVKAEGAGVGNAAAAAAAGGADAMDVDSPKQQQQQQPPADVKSEPAATEGAAAADGSIAPVKQEQVRPTAAAADSMGRRDAAAERTGEEDADNEGPLPASATDPHSLKDTQRPFNALTGCRMCWSEGDKGRLLLCDGCEDEYHCYCVNPVLLEVPEGDWYCRYVVLLCSFSTKKGEVCLKGGARRLQCSCRLVGVVLWMCV